MGSFDVFYCKIKLLHFCTNLNCFFLENFDKQISVERVKEINDFISIIGEKLIKVQLNLMLEEATKVFPKTALALEGGVFEV